jgi:tetratricopeptide (TPR) repeat protein
MPPAFRANARPLAPAPDLSRALALHSQGDFAAAETIYRLALAAQPRNLDALNLIGVLLTQTGRAAEGLARIEAALAIKPDFLQALNNRAQALIALNRCEEAVACLDKALKLRPDYAPAHINRAQALLALRRPAEALANLDRALALQPGSLEALDNLCAALEELGRLDEALAVADRALALKRDHAPAHNNRGVVLRELGRFGEAAAAFDRALAAAPGFAEARFNRATLALLRGDYASGWADYESRWARPGAPARLVAGLPEWRGEPLEGRSLLVYAEQGFGDVIQFSRYLRRVDGATLRVPPALCALMRRLCPETPIVASAAGRWDLACALASLPRLCGGIPAPTPPAPDPKREAFWRERLGGHGLRIGIAWQGAKGGKVDVGRSAPLAEFAPLARIPGVRLISLQKGEPLGDLPEVEAFDLDAGPDAFLDTAALMASLDLVVSTDTAIAHLAGALGRPVWAALKQVPDWRWGIERADSPWYPTMRLFRQRARGDWPQVFADMAGALRELAAAPCEGAPASRQ